MTRDEYVETRFKTGKTKKRKRPSLSTWREAVLRRDGGRCRMCGYHGPHVSAHHLIFLSHCRSEYSTDVRNGISLCNGFAGGCHEAVHGGRRKIRRSMLPKTVVECMEEQGLTWQDGEPVGTLARYFCGG